jgi:C-terminal processing protease CtpA/Prc
VLCFSTGYHDDYRRNTDVSDKLNFVGEYDIINYIYRIVSEIDKQSKLIFNKTNDQLQKLENQKLDLGIIPDFSYTDYGVKIATTMPQKKANIAGMMSGDIITKIGPFTIYDFEEYLKAMKKTEPGREVTIIVKRGNNEFKFFVVL